jgi:Uracil DNA glycosylase superfamily
MHEFCPGYGRAPYSALVSSYPDESVLKVDDFRVEWGPVFHRGRLDQTARILVVGQDPAQHEAVVRRILVGTAGRRLQGFLTRLGLDRSYVMINTFAYSVYGQGGGSRNVDDPVITGYRNKWLDAIVQDQPIEAVLSLGTLANQSVKLWQAQTGAGKTFAGVVANMMHPTYPESASALGQITRAAAMAKMLTTWNAALDRLSGHLTPDTPRTLTHYGTNLATSDLSVIPECDLPPGLPAWMRSDQPWATREGADAVEKRSTIVIRIPASERPF